MCTGQGERRGASAPVAPADVVRVPLRSGLCPLLTNMDRNDLDCAWIDKCTRCKLLTSSLLSLYQHTMTAPRMPYRRSCPIISPSSVGKSGLLFIAPLHWVELPADWRQAAPEGISARSAVSRGQESLQSAKNCSECRTPDILTGPDDWSATFPTQGFQTKVMNKSFLCQCCPQSSQNILWLMEEISHWSCLRFYKPMVYGKFSLYAVPFQGWEEVSCFTVLILWDKQANIIIKCWQVSRVSLSADSIEQQILSRWGSQLRSRGKGVPCITPQLTFGWQPYCWTWEGAPSSLFQPEVTNLGTVSRAGGHM